MLFPEFKKYLEEHSSGYEIFLIKATNMQNEKNKKGLEKQKNGRMLKFNGKLKVCGKMLF